MFVNNIPLQLQINSDTKFEELLETVKENVLFAMQNQPYPYDALVKLLNINSNTNLFDVMFTYQNENSNLSNNRWLSTLKLYMQILKLLNYLSIRNYT